MEGAATTVYAQGGRGNARLVAWEGERTVTFTMEDALISPEGFMILSGAGLIEATDGKPIYQHVTETVDKGEVSVNEKNEGRTIVLELHVAEGDMGKVIGKQGRIAKAIRSVVKAAASKENKKVIVDIM